MHRLISVSVAFVVTLGQPTPVAGAQDAPRPGTVGLALSGGSAKGIAHVGVLRALERLGVHVDMVSGTSAGSVIGALYAMDISVDSIERVVTTADWPGLIGDAVPRERRFLEQRRRDERTILNVPLRGAGVTLPVGAIAGRNLVRLLEHITWGAATVRRFEDLPRPFVAVATDLETGEAVRLTGGVLSEALRASSGIPGALEPVVVDGRLLVDGALSRNLPAEDVRALGADFVICSDVSDPLESAEELESFVDVLMQLASFSMLESTRVQRELCDVLIQPEIEGLSSLAFDEVEAWVRRGEEATALQAEALRSVGAAPPLGVRPRLERPRFLGDSVRVVTVEVRGTQDPRAIELVSSELELAAGDYLGRERMADRLADLDATGLFGLVRYRLDAATDDDAGLAIVVDERPRDRLGVGLRYDDERSAALLFTGTVHNLVRYGSVTRFDVRVGEETHLGTTFRGRRRVTGSLGLGLSLGWSQAPLQLSAAEGGRTGVDIAAATGFVRVATGRGTSLGVDLTAERTSSSADVASGRLVSLSAVLDHESLDRVDFPRQGGDVLGRFEWGGTEVTPGESFTVTTIDARYFVPLHARLTLDVGGFVGHAGGPDLPVHRRFFLGGTHRSTVFRRTHPLFRGLDSQEQSGTSAQVATLGLRWEVRQNGYMRGGLDIGAVRDTWRLPLRTPMTGWSLSAGVGSLIGPIVLEVAKLGSDHDPRVSISVGRQF